MRRSILMTGLVLLLLGAVRAEAAARLDYAGDGLSRREVASMARDVLRAPRDSARRAAFLHDLATALEDDGYPAARISVEATGSGRDERLRVRVDAGLLHRLHAIVIATSGAADSAEFADALDLETGDVASSRRISAAVEQALRSVVDHGYAYARLGVTGWQADSGRVDLTLSGALGPLVTITRTRIDGLRVTQPSFAERAMGPLTGLPYNRAAAENARLKLEQLGLFESVTFDGLEGEGDWSRGHLVYEVVEPAYNRFDGAVGVQGEAGTVGSARLDLGNLLGTGRQTSLYWQSRGRGVVDLAARYVEPLLFGLPLGVRVGMEQYVHDTSYVQTRWGGRLTWALTGRETIEGGFDEERVVQETGQVEEAQTQYTVFAVERMALDRRFAPRRGSHARLDAAQIFKRERLRPIGERTSSASAVELRGIWHRPVSRTAGVTLELRSAGRFSTQPVLPVWERYPLGGATTLRGYDEEDFRVDRFMLSRLEWRWFFGTGAQRAFVFWDHAWMGTRLEGADGSLGMSDLHRDGYGAGLRIESAGGIIGVDYGLAAGRPPLEGKIHLQLVSTF